MNQQTVTLPASKQEITVRGMKVSEMNLLNDRAKMMNGQAAEELLSACLEKKEGVDLQKMMACDRNAILFAIRRATFGDEYDYTVQCPHCQTRSTYGINLNELKPTEGNADLVAKQLADPTALHPFELPEGKRTVYWSFSIGADLKKAIDIRKRKGDQLASALLQLRIKKVDGLAEEGKSVKTFLEEISYGDAEAFMDYYRECEPGYDEKIQQVCQNGLCGAEFEIDLPIDIETFFKRSVRKKS